MREHGTSAKVHIAYLLYQVQSVDSAMCNCQVLSARMSSIEYSRPCGAADAAIPPTSKPSSGAAAAPPGGTPSEATAEATEPPANHCWGTAAGTAATPGAAGPAAAAEAEATGGGVDYGSWPVKELQRFLREHGQVLLDI